MSREMVAATKESSKGWGEAVGKSSSEAGKCMGNMEKVDLVLIPFAPIVARARILVFQLPLPLWFWQGLCFRTSFPCFGSGSAQEEWQECAISSDISSIHHHVEGPDVGWGVCHSPCIAAETYPLPCERRLEKKHRLL